MSNTQAWNLRKHMSEKDMYVGTKAVNERAFPLFNGDNIMFVRLSYAEATYKMFDEMISNACDHAVNTGKVSTIVMGFDIKTGSFFIQNDGPGIPIKRKLLGYNQDHELHSIQDDTPGAFRDSKYQWTVKYNPQILCREPLSGTNLEKRPFHITGGVNGMGMKLVNYYSTWFECETVDQGYLYKQRFRECANIVDDPTIVQYNGVSYTKFSFQLIYEKLGYPNGYAEYIGYTLQNVIMTRAYQIALYLNTCGFKTNVVFQGSAIPTCDIVSIGKMFSLETIVSSLSPDNAVITNTSTKTPVYCTRIEGTQTHEGMTFKLPWDICIGITRESGFVHMSIVNGMYMIDGGTNIDMLMDQIIAHVVPKVKVDIDMSEQKIKNKIRSNLFIVTCGSINHASTGAQTKNKIGNPITQFANYQFTAKQLSEIYKLIEPFVVSSVLEEVAPAPITRVNRKVFQFSGYEEAEYAAHKNYALSCTLFIPEGNSARGQIERIRNDKEFASVVSTEYSGLYDTRGVPINVRKEIIARRNPRTGRMIIVKTERLENNERIKGLYGALGLDYTKTYVTEDEFNTLRYGKVVICVDQDEDGKGNICSLLLNYFATFWPALICRGFVQRLNTPLIRAWAKNQKRPKMYQFYSENEFKMWRQTLQKSDDEFGRVFTVKYYKGLATNGTRDFEQIFRDYHNNIITYTYDATAAYMFELYFGKKTADMRKEQYKIKEQLEYPSGQRQIPCSLHLFVDTRSFGQYHINRSFPGMDGLTLSRRKVIATLMKSKDELRKVIAISGLVISSMGYHHGDASLSGTITAMGQEQMCTLPLLTPDGFFGSKKFNGNDAGSSRYIEAKLNRKLTDLLFPKADKYLLSTVVDEGKFYEPKWYAPIIPLVLAESRRTPGHGWTTEIWARDIADIFKCTLSAITTNKLTELRMSQLRWRGELKTIEGKLYSIGKYTYDPERNVINITELPHGVSSNFFSTGRSRQTKEEREATRANTKGKKKKQTKKAPLPLPSSIAGEQKDINSAIARFDQGLFSGQELHAALLTENKALAAKVAACNRPGVARVVDKTTDKAVNIDIHLQPGAYTSICKAGDGKFDPIISYFYLRTAIHSHLNIIGFDGVMHEYKSYEEIFMDWFIMRRKLYNDRYQREKTLLEAKLYYLEALQKYCDADASGEIAIRKGNYNTEQCDQILQSKGFSRMNISILEKPGYVPTDQLMYKIFQDPNTVSFDYIHRMSQYEYHSNYRNKRADAIAKVKRELVEFCQPDPYFPGARMWLQELEKLYNVVQRGLSEGWDYDQVKPVY